MTYLNEQNNDQNKQTQMENYFLNHFQPFDLISLLSGFTPTQLPFLYDEFISLDPAMLLDFY